MPSIINSNINSLSTQNALNRSQSSLSTSLERLSSGLRINSAKDDAAGMAISDRATTQINGFTVAARNANDAISLSQTAEGSLSAIGNNLQRIRELALQSANSTNSASDRKALNAEASQLIAEVQRVGTTSQFNGLNLLDGTFSGSQFQVGANANQTISVSIQGATTTILGSFGGAGASVNATLNGSAAAAWTAVSTISINGTSVGATVAAPGITAGSAAAKANAINSKTALTGVSATAVTTVAGAAPAGNTALASGDLTINGVAIGPIASATTAVGQGSNAAAAINNLTNQTGVTASYSTTNGALTLTAADGRDIQIGSGNGSTAAVATDILNATGLTATSAGAGSAVVAPTAGAGSVTFSGAAVANDAVIINGVTFTFADAVGADAYTINSATSVTVTRDFTASNTAAANATSLNAAISQAKLAASATSTALASLTNTNLVAGTVALADSRVGLAATVGRTVTETLTNGTASASTVVGTDFTLGGGNPASAITGGTLTLSSAENFTLTQTGTALADAGLSSYAPALTTLSTVDISTVGGSNAAIGILDAALAQVNSQKASLGAYQNRFAATVDNLQTSAQNLTAARSRTRDADFASETANLSRSQVLQQAGIAILSQANQLPQQVLSLLR
jgi:flagellin